MAILCKPQPSSTRQTASSPARAGAADKYLKLKGREERWGGGRGARSATASAERDPPREQKEPESTEQKWGWGRRAGLRPRGCRVPRADLLPGALWTRKGALGREGGAFRGMCPAAAARDGSVRGVT